MATTIAGFFHAIPVDVINRKAMLTAASAATIAAEALGYCWMSSEPPATVSRLATSVSELTMIVFDANQLFISASCERMSQTGN